MTDFCTECGEVFETLPKCNEKIISKQSANYSRTTSELFTNNLKTGISQSDNLQSTKTTTTMTIDITDKEIEAICFAYTHLQFDHILNHNLQPKPKAHLLDAINTLGILVDRIEQDQKKQQQKPSES